MKTNSKFFRKIIDAMLVAVFMSLTSMYACFAQASFDDNASTDSDSVKRTPTSKTVYIRLAKNLNLSAVAKPIEIVNSPFAEYKPAIALHGDRLYFSRSMHPLNTGGADDKEDIWYADIDKDNGNKMSEPKRLEGQLNNIGPNFVSGVSVTGDTLILGNTYEKNGKMRAGISLSTRENGTWSKPRKISIRNDYNLSAHGNAYVSLRAKVIISAVERSETFGQRDLYVSFWVGGEASEPVNMGDIINSELDESSPYLACDTKTLYFASKGHGGYGGYDVFVSHRLDDTWTKWTTPENLGQVVNGPKDEEFFCVTHCKQYAYFSKQVGEQNVDIYKIPMSELFGSGKALFR
jgi:OOP family OmpA-OmpF porin